MIWMIVGYVKTYLDKCKRDNIGAFAAQAAFFIIMSAIPFLMVFSSLLKYTPISQDYLLEVMDKVTPNYISPFFSAILDEVYSNTVGIISITAIVAIWAAGKAIQYMTTGLNSVNGIYETRNWFVVRLWSILYTLVFVVTIVVVLLLLVFTNQLQNILDENIGVISVLVGIRPVFRWLIVYVVLCAFFTIIFKTLPNTELTIKSQIPGGIICATAWFVFSFFLSIYVNYFNGFSMYGSLTTIVLMMLWLYFCMYIMLMCAEANAFFQEILQKGMDKISEKYEEKKTS